VDVKDHGVWDGMEDKIGWAEVEVGVGWVFVVECGGDGYDGGSWRDGFQLVMRAWRCEQPAGWSKRS